ncbi:hypothetical protein EYF80_031929 [Liparis tanakae]|uniref:Uncharacterized protein n=1 Tax=Liparis tanakae TaxID=230148 RepID=A0A4Z2GW16_9TELE|nr:hypothetical protein EYF80_031929 [Liparis tanakae]
MKEEKIRNALQAEEKREKLALEMKHAEGRACSDPSDERKTDRPRRQHCTANEPGERRDGALG